MNEVEREGERKRKRKRERKGREEGKERIWRKINCQCIQKRKYQKRRIGGITGNDVK